MAPVLLAGRFSRAQRAKRRQHLQLEDCALTEQTKTRYYLGLRKVLPYFEKATCPDDLDDHISDYVHDMWRSGEPSLVVADALSALHHFQPWTRRRFPHAWKLYAVWKKIEIPNRAPPLTWAIVSSWAAFAYSQGLFEMSLLLLLGFHCLLRTGELLNLSGTDFQIGSDTGLVSLQNTKTGRRKGANEMVTIFDGTTLEVLRLFLGERRLQGALHAPLWTGSGSSFRSQFNWIATQFHMQHENFRPYSLRRGGATDYFQTCHSMEATLLRGRWESGRVARIYLSDALSHLPKLRMSPQSAAMLSRFSFRKLWFLTLCKQSVTLLLSFGSVEDTEFDAENSFAHPFNFIYCFCQEAQMHLPISLPGESISQSLCQQGNRISFHMKIDSFQFGETWSHFHSLHLGDKKEECRVRLLNTIMFLELIVWSSWLIRRLVACSLGSSSGPPLPPLGGRYWIRCWKFFRASIQFHLLLLPGSPNAFANFPTRGIYITILVPAREPNFIPYEDRFFSVWRDLVSLSQPASWRQKGRVQSPLAEYKIFEPTTKHVWD